MAFLKLSNFEETLAANPFQKNCAENNFQETLTIGPFQQLVSTKKFYKLTSASMAFFWILDILTH